MHDTDAHLSSHARIAALLSARAQIMSACHGLAHDTDLRVALDALQRTIDALQRDDVRLERRESLKDIGHDMDLSVAEAVERVESPLAPTLPGPRLRRR